MTLWGPIHAKAMPVLLTKPEEWDAWLDGPLEQAITLQRPLPNDLLHIVATGEKRAIVSWLANSVVPSGQITDDVLKTVRG
jgi:putative SOS response-associated peptidase YedK